MGGGNNTTVTVVSFSGAAVAILFWILGFFAPAFMMAAPTGAESIVTTFVVGLLCYFLPFGTDTSAKPLPPPRAEDKSE